MEKIYTGCASGFYAKWSLYNLWVIFSDTYVIYHKSTQKLWQQKHNYPIIAQGQGICYVHKASMMVDHCTQHEPNLLIHLRSITTNIQHVLNHAHKCYILAKSQGILAIITQIWHRAKLYFTCISGPWYLIMLPNMN